VRRAVLHIAVGTIAVISAVVSGTQLHVPAEYATIQGAIEASAPWDTVMVAPGEYDEFLTGPGHSFVLSGWFPADTTEELRTLLNPSPPADADTPSVIHVTQDTAIVLNIAFFNKAELRQEEWQTRSGGIESHAELLVVSNCRFDSVSAALYRGNHVQVTNSAFQACFGYCILPTIGGAVFADNCTFQGEGVFLVRAYSNSRITNCDFVCSESGNDFLSLSGSDIQVTSCHFGPCFTAFPVLRVSTLGNVNIENCVFEMIDRASQLILVTMDCPGPPGIPITIRDNVFRDYHGVSPAVGTSAIAMICQAPPAGDFGVIENNVFQDGSGNTPAGVSLAGSVVCSWNTFDSLNSANHADVTVNRAGSGDTLLARNNLFLPPGLAASTSGSVFDARWNWWGDSTGPYNAQENPEGEGAEVGFGVEFIPWLTSHPDSISDTSEVASEEPASLLANKFSLTAYPNPFNAVTELEIEVARAGEYEVELYDVTGRLVATLYAGRIERSRMVRVDASPFASGVYFARLTGNSGAKATAKMLLLK